MKIMLLFCSSKSVISVFYSGNQFMLLIPDYQLSVLIQESDCAFSCACLNIDTCCTLPYIPGDFQAAALLSDCAAGAVLF